MMMHEEKEQEKEIEKETVADAPCVAVTVPVSSVHGGLQAVGWRDKRWIVGTNLGSPPSPP